MFRLRTVVPRSPVVAVLVAAAALLVPRSLHAQSSPFDLFHSADAPAFGLGPQGFYLGTLDSVFQLRLRGVIQVDGRAYPGSESLESNENFLVRRARPYIEGTVARMVDLRLLPDFGQGKVQLLEAYIDFHPWTWLGIRAGKMKAPVGLERLQAEQSLLFIERGLTSDLAPDRDIGVDLHGDVLGSLFAYDVGIFDGAPDGAVIDTDNGGQKDIDARAFVHPLALTPIRLLQRMGLGAAVTWGRQQGTPTNPWLSTYASPGQIAFFSYLVDPKNIATVVSEGERVRYAPQINAYVGPVGMVGEWIGERVAVSKGATSTVLANQAWQATASFVLTREEASYSGVVPARPLGSGGFGALEIGARVEGLDVDPKTFSTYADPTRSARSARGLGGVANWYLNRNAKLAVQYEYTRFTGGAMGGDRAAESALIGRIQAFF